MEYFSCSAPFGKIRMKSRQLSIKLFFSSVLTCFKFRFLPVITLSCKRSCFMSLHRAPGENNNNKNYKKTKPCYFNYFHSSFCLRRGREGKNNLLQVKQKHVILWTTSLWNGTDEAGSTMSWYITAADTEKRIVQTCSSNKVK